MLHLTSSFQTLNDFLKTTRHWSDAGGLILKTRIRVAARGIRGMVKQETL